MKRRIFTAAIMTGTMFIFYGVAGAIPLANTVYFEDFESKSLLTEWTNSNTSFDSNVTFYLGDYTTNSSTILTLTGLGAHTELALDFDLYLFGSWDGENTTYGKDYFGLMGDGVDDIWTFTNHQTQGQTYPGSPSEIYGSGSSATYVYRDFDLTGTGTGINIAHTGDTFSMTFYSNTTQSDEWWGIDNVQVSINNDTPIPEPATMLLFGTGLVGLLGAKRRKNKKQ